jgi:predicted ATPase
VGRTSELTELAALLEANRLVTLTGSGGCGKTRLARETAHGLVPGWLGGVWWVELARVGADAEVAAAVAAVLGLATRSGQNMERAVARQLAEAGEPVLVVLDNCEHVVSAAATLTDGRWLS